MIVTCVPSYEVLITWRRLKAVSSTLFPPFLLYSLELLSSSLARMFGPGIYSSNVSSKADIYSGNVDRTVRDRVMIVNQVSLGRTKIMYDASHDMQHAPHLYNSVSRINRISFLLLICFFLLAGYCGDISGRRQSYLSWGCRISGRRHLCQCHNRLCIRLTVRRIEEEYVFQISQQQPRRFAIVVATTPSVADYSLMLPFPSYFQKLVFMYLHNIPSPFVVCTT